MYRFCASVLLCLALLAWQPASGWAARPFDEHCDRGVRLYQERHYEEAIVEFQAAYALHPWTRLLFNIAQSYRKLGKPRHALRYYHHYKQVEPQADPEIRDELAAGMAEAQAALEASLSLPEPEVVLPPPPPVVAPVVIPPPRPTPLHRRWWLWTGVSVLAAGVVTAAVLISQPWVPAAWKEVPDDDRRDLRF